MVIQNLGFMSTSKLELIAMKFVGNVFLEI